MQFQSESIANSKVKTFSNNPRPVSSSGNGSKMADIEIETGPLRWKISFYALVRDYYIKVDLSIENVPPK